MVMATFVLLLLHGCAGERAKDQEGLLQGLQEAHDHEGHPVQDWKGLSVRTG